MVVVPNGTVFGRVANLALLGAATCAMACSGGTEPADASQLRTTGTHEAVCHTERDNEPLVPGPGQAAWVQSYEAEITGIAVDHHGNWVLSQSGQRTVKLGRDGQQLWEIPFGRLVAVDANDHAYVASGRELVKLDANGNSLYALALHAAADASAESLAVDRLGNAIVSGPGLGTVKVDSSGQIAWSKDYFGHVAFDPSGNALVTGALEGSRDFGLGTLVSRGGADVFVLKLSPTGDAVFVHRFGDEAPQQRGESVSIDGEGNVLVAGVFDGAMDFGKNDPLKPSRCASDAWCQTSGFAVAFDGDGNTLWARELGAMRAVSSTASDANGFLLSGVMPGGVRPFRSSWLVALDANGAQRWRRAEWPETGIGAGRAVAVDACNNVLWSVTARPDLQTTETAYLAKLTL